MSDINYCNQKKEENYEYYKDKVPYKAAYDADNSIIDLAQALDGIRGGISVPKSIFKMGEVIKDGIKMLESCAAVVDAKQLLTTALRGAGVIAAEGGRIFEAGAGIYNMSGGSNHAEAESENDDFPTVESLINGEEKVPTKSEGFDRWFDSLTSEECNQL